MNAVIAIFYGLTTWMAGILYAMIAAPGWIGAAIFLGPFIVSGMATALIVLDMIVTAIAKAVAKLLTWRKAV